MCTIEGIFHIPGDSTCFDSIKRFKCCPKYPSHVVDPMFLFPSYSGETCRFGSTETIRIIQQYMFIVRVPSSRGSLRDPLEQQIEYLPRLQPEHTTWSKQKAIGAFHSVAQLVAFHL